MPMATFTQSLLKLGLSQASGVWRGVSRRDVVVDDATHYHLLSAVRLLSGKRW